MRLAVAPWQATANRETCLGTQNHPEPFTAPASSLSSIIEAQRKTLETAELGTRIRAIDRSERDYVLMSNIKKRHEKLEAEAA
jgi:hypothetical protein